MAHSDVMINPFMRIVMNFCVLFCFDIRLCSIAIDDQWLNDDHDISYVGVPLNELISEANQPYKLVMIAQSKEQDVINSDISLHS